MAEGIWDAWYERKLGVIEPEIPTLAKLLKGSVPRRVLDVGCGTGRHAVYFALNGFETWGFDVTENALTRARELLHQNGVKAELIVRDMFNPFPYKEGFFGAVIATRVIHHGYLNEIRKVAAEMNRVLAMSGYLFIQSSSWFPDEKIENPSVVEVEPRTLIWPEGEEANVPHHNFTQDELLGLFPNHEVVDMHARSEHYGGWCLITRKIA